MGSANVESDLRAALSCAPLSDAALGDIVNTVLTIISDAIEPGSRMGVTISSSHTSLQATTNGAVKAMFEITTPARATTAGEYEGVPLPYDNTPDRARAAGADADQTVENPSLMSPQQRARWDAAESGADQTTLTAVAVEMMRAGIAAGINEGAAVDDCQATGVGHRGTCGDEYVVECDEVRRDGGVQTMVMYKSCVVKHYQARQTAWLLDRTDRTA